MATLTAKQDGPGKGRTVQVVAGAARTLKMVIYNFAFDSSYPTGGESISAIWDDFTEVLGIWCSQDEATVADMQLIVPDLTNKKLILVKTLASGANVEFGSTNDASGLAAVKLLAIGYR